MDIKAIVFDTGGTVLDWHGGLVPALRRVAQRRELAGDWHAMANNKMGGDLERINLESLELAAGMDSDQLLALHEALERLTAHDAAKAELVKLRFFAGLTLEEAAKVLGVSEPTAKRHWAYARAWLYRKIARV